MHLFWQKRQSTYSSVVATSTTRATMAHVDGIIRRQINRSRRKVRLEERKQQLWVWRSIHRVKTNTGCLQFYKKPLKSGWKVNATWRALSINIRFVPTGSGNSGRDVNEHEFSCRSSGKFQGSNGTSEKVVLYFSDGMFARESRAPFLQSHLWYHLW